MPTLNKMNSDEIEALKKKKSGLSERAKTRQEYIEKLNKFQPGDWTTNRKKSIEDCCKRTWISFEFYADQKQFNF